MANSIKQELEELRKRRVNGENTAKSDGASLALGSSEYREYLRDQQGMDEFEQRKDILGKEFYRSGDAITPNKDEWHEVEAAKAALQLKERIKMRAYDDDGRLSTAERKVSHQIRKELYKDDVMRMALNRAEHTETKEDDKVIARRLPKDLEKQVYDDGVQDDEFYPGAKILNKYL